MYFNATYSTRQPGKRVATAGEIEGTARWFLIEREVERAAKKSKSAADPLRHSLVRLPLLIRVLMTENLHEGGDRICSHVPAA